MISQFRDVEINDKNSLKENKEHNILVNLGLGNAYKAIIGKRIIGEW